MNQWAQWQETDWNRALFRHYFAPDDNDMPVTRVLVSGRGLAQATGCEEEIEAVEERFLEVLAASPKRINERFRGNYFTFSAPFDEPPRAFLHLLFTCYVASAGDEGARSEADFRRRMAKILGHADQPYYPLEGLGHMWTSFADWLSAARRNGYRWRQLRLPDPGSMVRIGYSLRLAFPHRRDQALLEQMVAAEGFAAQPPLLALLEALHRHRDQFTDAFRAVYEEFRQTIIAGTFDAERSPLLDAVRDAIAHRDILGDQTSQASYSLVAERDDRGYLRLVLLADRPQPSGEAGTARLSSFEPDRAHGKFRYAIAAGSRDFAGSDSAIEAFLSGELPDQLTGFEKDPLHRISREGVLLFHRGTTGQLGVARNLNVEGEVWPLVHERLSERFTEALTSSGMAEPCPTAAAYRDWREFQSVSAERLRVVDWTRDVVLAGVRCLQHCAPDDRINLSGGIPAGEPRTWLGHRVVLPSVRVSGGATSVTLFNSEGTPLGELQRPIVGDSELFPLGAIAGLEPLEGEHELCAHGIGGRLFRRRIHFRAFVDGFSYLPPSNPDRWLCEAASSDVRPWSAEAVFADIVSNGSAQTIEIPNEQLDAGSTEDMASRLVAMVETCAARCLRRRDFSESEWIELFECIFEVRDARLAWLVLRAWVEAGHFDLAIDAAWRSRRLFARQPRLALIHDAEAVKARLVGLAPTILINQLRQRVAVAGGESIQRASASPWLAGVWEIRGLDLLALERLAHDLNLRPSVWVPAPKELVTSLANMDRRLLQRPMNYELFRSWSWNRQGFFEQVSEEKPDVKINWWHRANRLDAPDCFTVERAGSEIFVTYSRNWALLTAAAIVARALYRRDGGILRSTGYPWAFLPITVGRFCFAAGVAAAGPVFTEDGVWSYSYPLGNSLAAARVLAELGFLHNSPKASVPAWLNALASVRSRSEPLVRLSLGVESVRRVPASLRPLFVANRRTL